MDYIFPGIMIFSILLMVGMGIAVKYFKAYWLISGYNMMSKEKKERVDVVGLANFTGNVVFIMALLMAVATVLILMKQEILGGIAFAAFLPLSIYMVVKSQRFDANTRNIDGSMTKKSKFVIWVYISLMLLTTIGVGVLWYFSAQPAQFTLGDDYFAISGIYGEKIFFEEIDGLIMGEELPRILMRNNGSSLGSIRKGNFKLEGIDKGKLFLDTAKPPFIFLTAKGKVFIFSAGNRQETEELFAQLIMHL